MEFQTSTPEATASNDAEVTTFRPTVESVRAQGALVINRVQMGGHEFNNIDPYGLADTETPNNLRPVQVKSASSMLGTHIASGRRW